MNMTLIVNVFLIAMTLFFAFRILKLSGRTKENKKMLKILDSFDDRDVFFESAEDFIATEKNQEFVNKVSVLRLWGDAYYERDEDYKRHLAELNIDGLLDPDGKKNGYSQNEDSFFYLYLAIPNRMYYRGRNDLRKMIYERMAEYDDVNDNAILRVLNAENRKFYEDKEDKGKAFINSLLDGEYGGYKYSKQLIGLYKHCEEAILAVILRDEGDEEGYQECVSNLEHFAKETRLGKRWTKELGIEIKDEEETPAEEEGEEGQEEVKAIEMKDPEIKTELTEAEDTEVKEDA